MDPKSVLTVIAAVCTIGMFLTGMRACQKIRLQGNTQNVSIMPFLCTFINCTFWLKYGLLKDDGLMIFVNMSGAILSTVYLSIYYIHSIEKDKAHKSLLYGGLILYSILVYVKFYLDDLETALSNLGTVGCVSCILMYASPLAMIAEVCQSKCTESLPFSMSLASFVVSLEWLMYGHIISDFYVEFPNFLGVILGLIQLLLFVWYPSTPMRKGSTGPTSTV